MIKIRTRADLDGLFGDHEDEKIEFKSSRGLINSPDKNSIRKFLGDQIVPTVSAFLNSEGGTLIIGIEENKNGEAISLSDGVSREVLDSNRLQQMIVDTIHPSVADLVNVNAVLISPHDGSEKKYAFVIEVKSGITAYQCGSDKIYYARRAGQSVPMDDKDVRVRMMSGDKPRIELEITRKIHPYSIPRDRIAGVTWTVAVKNEGLRTIKRAFVNVRMEFRDSQRAHLVS